MEEIGCQGKSVTHVIHLAPRTAFDDLEGKVALTRVFIGTQGKHDSQGKDPDNCKNFSH